jgi:DNA adenine methylase
MNGFLKYNEKIFSWNDQIRLKNCVNQAVSRGVFVLVSNAPHESIYNLYRDLNPEFRDVTRHSVIAAERTRRGSINELLIVLRP